MSVTTGYRPLNPIKSSGGSLSLTGYQNKIREANPHLGKSAVQRIAKKIAKRAAQMQAEFDFYAELRILGIYSDKTARAAIEGDMRYAA